MKSLSAIVALSLSAVLLLGCPNTGIVCTPGTDRCGQGCIDPKADSKNCGACGNACRSGQICAAGSCECGFGTVACDGECTVLDTDPKNCGGCAKDGGQVCAGNQVCEATDGGAPACRLSCPLGADAGGCQPNGCPGNLPDRCAGACVDVRSSSSNCGACGVSCQDSQTCHAGHCGYDLVAACFNSGQVVGIQQRSEARGPRSSLGTAPAALASYGEILLAADGIDQRLYQAALDGGAYAQLTRVNSTGSVPNQILVDAPWVYVVNSGAGTLQVLMNFGQSGVFPDGGPVGAQPGLALATVAELQLGANSYPEGIAKVGAALWVPLYGGLGAAAAAAGQKVVRIDISNPAFPSVTDTIDLSTLNLKPFDGGAPVARPYAILAHQGALYVALNNLNPGTYLPEGPGLLAKIDPSTRTVSAVIDLGGSTCLDPVWLASSGAQLLVSCVGNAVYGGPPNFELVTTDRAAIVAVDTLDGGQSSWTPGCPTAADGGPGCVPILPGRFAVFGSRVFVGDQNGGRLFVLELNGNSLTERRGYYGDAGQPIDACAVDPVTKIGNVSDVLSVP